MREVVAIGVDPGGPGSPTPPPAAHSAVPPAPDGAGAGSTTRPGYSVAIFRSPRPVRLTARTLPPLAPSEPAERFLQLP